MKIYYKFDAQGYFLPGEDVIVSVGGENPIGNYTEKPPMLNGKGMYKPRFVAGEWVEEGQAPEPQPVEPTVDEKVSALERDNQLLRLQNDVLADQYQFLEDVVTEMIVTTMP